MIVYDDLPAGRRAMSMLTRLLGQDAHAVHLFPTVWRFDMLENPDFREQAIGDALAGDLLILSTSESGAIPSVVETCISAFLSQRHGAGTAFLALFGHRDDWSISIRRTAEVPGETWSNPTSIPNPALHVLAS